MDCCIVCLQTNCHPFSRIHIHSSEWNREQIQRVVEKHLWWWYLKPQDKGENIKWICKHCWQEISSFHNFYLKVEMVHKQYDTLLPTDLSQLKCKEFTSEAIQDQYIHKSKPVNSIVNEITNENDKPCSSTDLELNKKIHQKQVFQSKIIKNKPFNVGFQRDKNNVQVKEESQDNSLNDDNANNVCSRIEQNYYDNHDMLLCEYEYEEKESSESPETRAKLKKNDIIDFYDKFQFKLECIVCNSIESTFANLCAHYKDQHNMRGFAMCCGVKFARRYLLIDHLCVHKNPNFFKCHRCHRVYRARDNLNFHLRKNKCTPKFECNECGKQFLILKNLKRHKLIHLRPMQEKYLCNKCNRNFKSKDLLEIHAHTGNCEIVCNDCGQIFRQYRSLGRHIKNNCPVRKTIKSNAIIDSNITIPEIVLGGGEDITPNIKIEPSDNFEIHQDEHIPSNESNMIKIQEYVENIEDDSNSNNDEENRTFRVKAFKNMYTPSVSDDFFREMQYEMECRICNSVLPDFQSLISHYRTLHNKVGYGMCCGKKYYRRGVLADHLKLHKDPNLFKCQLCNRKLGTRRGLEKHIGLCAKRL